MVICLQPRGADLHIAQLMPLPFTLSCFSNIQTGFTFLVPAQPGSPRQRAIKRARVCLFPDFRSTSAVNIPGICKFTRVVTLPTDSRKATSTRLTAPHQSVLVIVRASPHSSPTSACARVQRWCCDIRRRCERRLRVCRRRQRGNDC